MKAIFVVIAALLPAIAVAHEGHHHLINWQAGFLHPLTGVDHLLALVATGIWLAQSDTRGKPGFIAAFAVLLAIAIALGTQFTHMNFESGIATSLVVLGGLLASATRGPFSLRAVIVGMIALVHGFVHGTELPTGAGVLPFAIALIGSSAILLTISTMMGCRGEKILKSALARVAGFCLVLFGIAAAF